MSVAIMLNSSLNATEENDGPVRSESSSTSDLSSSSTASDQRCSWEKQCDKLTYSPSGSKVQLCVYDLSNGIAMQFSKQLTGRQIDGIWHTSVVVFGKEIFYRQGITVTEPGKSQHGEAQTTVDMGETDIDAETFDEYLEEIRDHYTEDKYHLLNFNCNTFTNDCISFLTGGSTVPPEISDLPSLLLSTRHEVTSHATIDSFSSYPIPGSTSRSLDSPAGTMPRSPDPALASALLQAIASQTYQDGAPSASTSGPRTTLLRRTAAAQSIHVCTEPSSLHSLLQSHRAVIVFFTLRRGDSCKIVETEFETLAAEKARAGGSKGVAFVEVDMAIDIGGRMVATYGVRDAPTFLFFLEGQKTHELKGAVDARHLRIHVEQVLSQAFPSHPHTKLSLPTVEAFPMDPILLTQLPDINKISAKLVEFSEAAESDESDADFRKRIVTAKQSVSQTMASFLRMRFPNKDKDGNPQKTVATGTTRTSVPPATTQALMECASATRCLTTVLTAAQLFPLVDMWRLALLDEGVAKWFGEPASKDNVLDPLLRKALEVLESNDSEMKTNARNYFLTLVRMLTNGFAYPTLRTVLMSPSGFREELTRVVVATLLDGDARVREAAASLVFNIAAMIQKTRVEKAANATTGKVPAEREEQKEVEEEWEIDVVSAVLQAMSNEVKSVAVVHRLVVALAFCVRLSPSYEGQLSGLLVALQAKDVLLSKLKKGGCGENGVQEARVQDMIREVSEKLCP